MLHGPVLDKAIDMGVAAVILTEYAFEIPSEVRTRCDVLLKPVRPDGYVAAESAGKPAEALPGAPARTGQGHDRRRGF